MSPADLDRQSHAARSGAPTGRARLPDQGLDRHRGERAPRQLIDFVEQLPQPTVRLFMAARLGVVGEELMVRVGPDAYEDALGQPHGRLMDFTGRPMKGMVFVEPAGLKTEADLRTWVQRGVDFAMSLPAK